MSAYIGDVIVRVRRCLASVAVLAVGGAATFAWQAQAGRDLVTFPEAFADGVHYATVTRGSVREELFTTAAAIDAVRGGRAIPGGTVITLVDYRDGALFRYVVMEKRAGWGAGYPQEVRNGEWEYQAFNADKTVNTKEDVGRCFACHKAQSGNDFVFTRDRMKAAPQ